MDCWELVFSRHAVQRMFERGITTQDIRTVITDGEIIIEYADDKPFPSYLVLGFINDSPVHVVVAFDGAAGRCHIVTTYQPDPATWSKDFKTRRV